MGGEIHVLVNCAGIQRRSPAVQFPEKDWDDVRVPFPILFCRVRLRVPCLSVSFPSGFGLSFHFSFDLFLSLAPDASTASY